MSDPQPTTKHRHKCEQQILIQAMPPSLDPRIYTLARFEPVPPATGVALATASTNAKIGGQEVSFAVPAHAALCLSLSHKAFQQLQVYPLDRIFTDTGKGVQVMPGNLTILFSAFECLLVNTVFAVTALEAYANQSIPEDFVFSKLRQDQKCKESYDKMQIERNLSLDLKLSVLLPEILGIPFPKGEQLWNDYKLLRETRDRIIHVKTADLGIHDREAKSIWAILLDRRNIDASKIAHAVIKIFPQKHDPSSSPVAAGRNVWVDLYPFTEEHLSKFGQKAKAERHK